MAQMARRVVDRPMLKLIRAWLRTGVPEGGVTSPAGAGTPQGPQISPLLANIALHVLDEVWQDEGRRLGVLVRYCDDFVVLSPTRQRAEQAREMTGQVLSESRVRENCMHGLKRRGLETESRAAAPVPDPTQT